MCRDRTVADDRDREIENLQRQLRWLEEDNAHVWKLLDDAVAQLREAHQRNDKLRQQRVDDAHARTVEAEQRLAAATLAAREPMVRLH
jgi:hypothetical protein